MSEQTQRPAMTPRYHPEDEMRLPTAMRWVDTIAAAGTSAKLPCPLCNGQGWLHFSCGTPWRCKCNQSSSMTPRYQTRTGRG